LNIIDIGNLIDTKEYKIIYDDIQNLFLIQCIDEKVSVYQIDCVSLTKKQIYSFKYKGKSLSRISIVKKNNNLFFIWQEKDYLKIDRLCLNLKEITAQKSYYVAGNEFYPKDTVCLSENILLIFFREIKSGDYDGFLCDISEDKSYYINDRRIVDSLKEFRFYQNKNEEYICFEEIYMSCLEKENIYFAAISGEIYVNDCVEEFGIIKLKDFVDSIKSDKDFIKFKILDDVTTKGYIRYMGMDKSYIYYRKKNFETQIEEIYRTDKNGLKLKNILNLNHTKDIRYFYIEKGMQIFKYQGGYIEGVYASDLKIPFDIRNVKKVEFINEENIIWYDNNDMLNIKNLNGCEIKYNKKAIIDKNGIILI